MSINIENIAERADAATWKDAYHSARPEPHTIERQRALQFAARVALDVIDQCLREIQGLRVLAPDAEIVKDKISGRLRAIAGEVRKANGVENGN
jgi:hypothetical protein